MIKKILAYIMAIVGCIIVVAITIFLYYYTQIQKQPIDDNDAMFFYSLFLIFIIFIIAGFGIIDDIKKSESENEK